MTKKKTDDTEVSIDNQTKPDEKSTSNNSSSKKRKDKSNSIGVWLSPDDYNEFIQKRDAFGFENNSAFLKTIISYDHISLKEDIKSMREEIEDLKNTMSILITDINKTLQNTKSIVAIHTTSLPTPKTSDTDKKGK